MATGSVALNDVRLVSSKEPSPPPLVLEDDDASRIVAPERSEDYSTSIPANSKDLGYGGYTVCDTHNINMLLIGRSQSGKSTIIDSLQEPQSGFQMSGFSTTKVPSCSSLIITDENANKKYQLNIIDTPGLRELCEDNKNRSDDDLMSLITFCVDNNITTLNLICFVSKAGETHQLDVEVFEQFMKYFGKKLSAISLMVLTHSDRFTTERLEYFEQAIKRHPKSKNVYSYCEVGCLCVGAIDSDSLAQYGDNEEHQKRELRRCLKKLEPFRKNFIECILNSAGWNRSVSDFDAVQAAYRAKKVALDKVNYAHNQSVEKNKSCIIS